MRSSTATVRSQPGRRCPTSLGEGHERDLLASLYWPLQEFIYANGELDEPIRWAAQRVRDTMPRFSTGERPLAFTGEAMFPWMFEQESALRRSSRRWTC